MTIIKIHVTNKVAHFFVQNFAWKFQIKPLQFFYLFFYKCGNLKNYRKLCEFSAYLEELVETIGAEFGMLQVFRPPALFRFYFDTVIRPGRRVGVDTGKITVRSRKRDPQLFMQTINYIGQKIGYPHLQIIHKFVGKHLTLV